MIETEIPQLIGTLGFPIVITFYLLFKFEKKLTENTHMISQLIIFLKTKR